MKALFFTQSKSIPLFHRLARDMETCGTLRRAGFYIADSEHFEKFSNTHSETLIRPSDSYVYEWKILAEAASTSPDIEKLKQKEEEYAPGTFWEALMSDRRIYFGKKATVEQNYKSPFSHNEMLAILQKTIEEVERLFDEVQPDVIVTFIAVTLGESIAALIAKKRNIKIINLRPTRLRNYFYAGEDLFEPSEKIGSLYRQLLEKKTTTSCGSLAKEIIEDTRRNHAMYEGVISASSVTEKQPKIRAKNKRSILKTLKKWFRYHYSDLRYDYQFRGIFYPKFYRLFKGRWRKYRSIHSSSIPYMDESFLKKAPYAFFPLHKEPEVTLLVYSRPFLNQIEVARQLARSLPVGMKLAIKDHPAAMGYRSLSYYRKLLEIPNAVLLHPSMSSRTALEHAQLTTVIAGSIGLESLFLKKPVVALGKTPFSHLPSSMIRTPTDLFELPKEIKEILKGHRHDEEALKAYVEATLSLSVPVDYYSVLLAREGVFQPQSDKKNDFDTQLRRLSHYIEKQVQT